MRAQTTCTAAALACFLLGSHTALGSEAKQGVYIGLGVGANWKAEASVSGPAGGGSADYSTGYGALGSVGYAFQGGPRIELEGSIRKNQADTVTPGGGVSAATDLDQTVTAGMLNFLYDFHNDYDVVPTIGAGLGFAVGDAGDIGENIAFAYQAIAGISHEIADGVTLFGEYRLFATEEISGDGLGGDAGIENINHSAFVGVRLRLGDPFVSNNDNLSDLYPRPATQLTASSDGAAGSAMQRQGPASYIVFFAFDQAGLSSAAEAVVRTAAANIRAGQAARLEVTGHADRAGTAGYNEQLSTARAQAVRAILEAEGVPGDAIVVMGKGEQEPLVLTADGQPEPQNRRVEIVLN